MKKFYFLFFSLLLYLLAGFVLIHLTGYFIDSPDTIFYLTISKKYASGDFYSAINNYWSPLISWLLVPFVFFHFDPAISFKALQLLIGAVGLVISYMLAEIFLKGKNLNKIFLVCLIPAFLSYAILYQTPDLLFLVLLLFLLFQFFCCLNWSEYAGSLSVNHKSLYYGISTGITGALLYFTKAYGLPFFAGAYTFIIALSFIQSRDKKLKTELKRKYISGMLTFVCISFLWITCLHYKYGTFSTGYASVYNFNLLAPAVYKPGTDFLQHPVLEQGLMDISSREEASAWESPGSFRQTSWSPFKNQQNFLHYLKIAGNNWISFYYFIISRNIGLIFIFSWLLFFMITKKPVRKISPEIQMVSVFLSIFILGYSLIFFMPRYLWLCIVLFPLISFKLWEIIIFEKAHWKWLALTVFGITFFFMTKKPVKEILYKKDIAMPVKNMVAGILHPVSTLLRTYEKDRKIPQLIRRIKLLHLEKGKVAGLNNGDPGHPSYTLSLILCMYLNQTFYGELESNQTSAEKNVQLRQYGINYLYCWEPGAIPVADAQKLLEDTTTNFVLYSIK